MNYAIIDIGGSQKWVEENKFFVTHYINLKVGSLIKFNRILLITFLNKIKFGFPYLKLSNVYGEIIQHKYQPKIISFKMKSKKKYRLKKGFRLYLTYIKIIKIKF